MEYLRGKLRGKTPSWGRDSEVYDKKGSESNNSRRSPFSWARRDSGGSISSLWNRTSRSRNDSCSDWKMGSEDRGSSSFWGGRRSSQTDFAFTTSKGCSPSPVTSPKGRRNYYSGSTQKYGSGTEEPPWRTCRSSVSTNQTPTNDFSWRSSDYQSTPYPQSPSTHRQYSPPSTRFQQPLVRSQRYTELDQNVNYKELFEKEKQEKEV